MRSKEKGIGINKCQAQIIMEKQEYILRTKHIPGEDSPQQLTDTLVYLIGFNFGPRAGNKHIFPRVGSSSQSVLSVDSSGYKKSLIYTDNIS